MTEPSGNPQELLGIGAGTLTKHLAGDWTNRLSVRYQVGQVVPYRALIGPNHGLLGHKLIT